MIDQSILKTFLQGRKDPQLFDLQSRLPLQYEQIEARNETFFRDWLLRKVPNALPHPLFYQL